MTHTLHVTGVTGYSSFFPLLYDPYSPVSHFFAKLLLKVPYEGLTHMHKWGWKKLYGPITKVHGLVRENFKPFCLQIGHMIKYLLTKSGWAEWENIWFSVMVHGPHCTRSMTSSQRFSRPALLLSQKEHNIFCLSC